MNIRKWFGLCQHSWRAFDPPRLFEHSYTTRLKPNDKIFSGYSETRECKHCGELRRFML